MIPPEALLVMLVKLIDRIPMSPPPSKRKRGHRIVYPDRLFLQELIIMIMRHMHIMYELLAALNEGTCEMQTLCTLLAENGRYPSRRTWERRLKTIPEALPAQIAYASLASKASCRTLVTVMQSIENWERDYFSL